MQEQKELFNHLNSVNIVKHYIMVNLEMENSVKNGVIDFGIIYKIKNRC